MRRGSCGHEDKGYEKVLSKQLDKDPPVCQAGANLISQKTLLFTRRK